MTLDFRYLIEHHRNQIGFLVLTDVIFMAFLDLWKNLNKLASRGFKMKETST